MSIRHYHTLPETVVKLLKSDSITGGDRSRKRIRKSSWKINNKNKMKTQKENNVGFWWFEKMEGREVRRSWSCRRCLFIPLFVPLFPRFFNRNPPCTGSGYGVQRYANRRDIQSLFPSFLPSFLHPCILPFPAPPLLCSSSSASILSLSALLCECR